LLKKEKEERKKEAKDFKINAEEEKDIPIFTHYLDPENRAISPITHFTVTGKTINKICSVIKNNLELCGLEYEFTPHNATFYLCPLYIQVFMTKITGNDFNNTLGDKIVGFQRCEHCPIETLALFQQLFDDIKNELNK
jgi:hypothetical protein